jgi:Rad3-related DNA helicase
MIQKIDLEEQILVAYNELGFSPRGNQAVICHDVLDAFLNKGKKNVCLVAGTGVGKSVLGAVISRVIDHYTPESSALASTITMGTNSLARQYAESFSALGKYEFFQVQGASNYSCPFMESQLSATIKTADACVKKNLIPQESDKYCSKCEYDAAKKVINSTSNLITNYTYFMVSALASHHLKERKLNVFDEAHTLSDWFCSYAEILVSVDLIDRYIKELGDTNGKCDDQIAGLIVLKQKVSSNEVSDENYIQYLKILLELYNSASRILASQSVSLKTVDIVKSGKFDKISAKYASLGMKISDTKYIHYQDYFHR